MPIIDICNLEIVTLQRDDTVVQASKVMREFHVGAVVVTEEKNGIHVPVGIVTDRDVVVGVIAPELDPSVMTVGDIMVTNLVIVDQDSGIFEAIQLMSDKGVRRLPVVGKNGELVGIVTLDDLFVMMTKELGSFSKLLIKEQKNEANKCR